MPAQNAMVLVRSALPQAGLHITGEEFRSIRASGQMTLVAWPATVMVTVEAEADDRISINLTVTNFGFGPIQNKHVRKTMERLVDVITKLEKMATGG